MHNKIRKIIHIDMDCFFAAIEIRDTPSLANKPVAVGGMPDQRGVICTCNYIARKSGVHSAMPSATALRYCPDLILLPVDMPKYRNVANRIHDIFKDYTPLVEPLSLDEAYLDVTDIPNYHGSATLMADAIRSQIWEREQLIASAGVAPNKFLAKIASGWKKPNGFFIIQPHEVAEFVASLPVDELFGVGSVTAKKLHKLGLKTCSDLQKLSLAELVNYFGKFGHHLYEQCHGVDHRAVQANRTRKSMSVEQTFAQDISSETECMAVLEQLFSRLLIRLSGYAEKHRIKNQFLKIKFYDFTLKTIEIAAQEISIKRYSDMFRDMYHRENKPIRLLGLGVHFVQDAEDTFTQLLLF